MELNKQSNLKNKQEKQGRYTIHSVEKGLDVIEMLSQHHSLSLIELAELVEQPKSSLYRIMLTLENRRFITRTDDGKYCLGFKQLIMTKKMMKHRCLRKEAMVEMNKLMKAYGDTVNLCVLSEGEVLYVEIMEGSYALCMSNKVGAKYPFHATAAGKAMAAFLPVEKTKNMIIEKGLTRYTTKTIHEESNLFKELKQIRQLNYALDNEELIEGARSIMAPIFNMFGQVEGAIGLSGARHRFPLDRIPEMAKDVTDAAQNISQKLGFVR